MRLRPFRRAWPPPASAGRRGRNGSHSPASKPWPTISSTPTTTSPCSTPVSKPKTLDSFAVTNVTNALAVVVSQTTGTVRLFQKGEVILRIAPTRHHRALKWHDTERAPLKAAKDAGR